MRWKLHGSDLAGCSSWSAWKREARHFGNFNCTQPQWHPGWQSPLEMAPGHDVSQNRVSYRCSSTEDDSAASLAISSTAWPKFFFSLCGNCLHFNVCLLPLALCHWALLRRPWLYLLYSPTKKLQTWVRCPWVGNNTALAPAKLKWLYTQQLR